MAMNYWFAALSLFLKEISKNIIESRLKAIWYKKKCEICTLYKVFLLENICNARFKVVQTGMAHTLRRNAVNEIVP